MAAENNATGYKILNGSLIISSFLSNKTHGSFRSERTWTMTGSQCHILHSSDMEWGWPVLLTPFYRRGPGRLRSESHRVTRWAAPGPETMFSLSFPRGSTLEKSNHVCRSAHSIQRAFPSIFLLSLLLCCRLTST